ncbi:ion channel protein [Streptomyces marianii]|uniref:Ion channel protein n=1 Tax=Streptomyces marianii TaxID=1817406 RepID=A0A5R9EHF1_9ACTN|nr:ion channel protein [Streptomyces marianii]
MLLPLIVPAIVVGVASSLLLIGLTELSRLLKGVLWELLPDAIGVGRYSAPWTIAVLTGTGLAVGLVVWKVPGHAGPDPATTGLVDPPMPPSVVPSLLLTAVLGLAGGVSLGPENPITAANIALAAWLGGKAMRGSRVELWAALAAAGTVGALFGTPVAAALILTESLASRPAPGALWDKLFAPLIAGGAGSLTTVLIAHPTIDLALPALSGSRWGDVPAALAVSSLGALAGMAAVHVFPYTHAAFRKLGHPVAAITAGGLVLGLLGALGGQLTLFKGLEEVRVLAADPSGWSSGQFALMTVVKLAALTIAATCGFRGGRIFPSLFVGVALGLGVSALVPEVHPTIAVACAVLGLLLAITRQGWLSLFTAALLAADPHVLPLLCVALLPAWLLVTGRPQMQLHDDGTPLR